MLFFSQNSDTVRVFGRDGAAGARVRVATVASMRFPFLMYVIGEAFQMRRRGGRRIPAPQLSTTAADMYEGGPGGAVSVRAPAVAEPACWLLGLDGLATDLLQSL